MGKGSELEGKLTEIGGLIQQDTGGKLEYLRQKTTSTPDEGVDHEIIINDPNFNIEKYFESLKKEEKNSE